ncbi:MAG: hypothetical protein OXK72_03285 [Gammaproteobacteria bacterium]|nr:hypothetical protein [Gammaproteobacteria bacterium]MDE0411076.1 hypothetical protein [Gammaproteobacteria bacterium]
MATERIPHPEFQVYAKQMERIKRIVMKVIKEPIPTDPEDIGAQAQKIRRVLETIVNACLAVQMEVGDAKHLRRFANMSRAEVLKDRVDGDHYPSVGDVNKLGRAALVVARNVPRDEYLTRDRWFTVWNGCGRLVHEESPGSTKPKPRYDTYHKDSRIWLQWIINLLSLHTMFTKDMGYYALVSLHNTRVNGTLLEVQKRITPWETTVKLKDDSFTLQRKIDSEWRDVVDPAHGAVAIMETIGYYTASKYWSRNR